MFVLATPVQFWIGFSLYVASFVALKHFSLTMNVLITLGTTVAYFYSLMSALFGMFYVDYKSNDFFETSIFLITFVILGRYLENLAKGKTSEAISKLLSLQAKTAIVLSTQPNGEIVEEEVSIDLVEKGDILKIVPGASIPTDGALLFLMLSFLPLLFLELLLFAVEVAVCWFLFFSEHELTFVIVSFLFQGRLFLARQQ
jgi:Cu+-exporting ATPase